MLVSPELARWVRHEDCDPLPAMGTMATHPLMAAACLGVLDELEEMDFAAFAARGERLGEAMTSLKGAGPVQDIHGRGFLYGVEVAPGKLWSVMKAVEDRGVFFYPFTGAGEPESEGLVVAPPLTSTDEDIEFLSTALSGALDAVS
ncbi:aminotransferase class III-fold pyridoxal phosphate-dependent enzyme [Streptomyces sp. NPDC017435]|uniref:aminotransferase class III-fold pyridoxal phosphate-dependent enzyme n=1 Tax=Streptomyces sp. NPDC017435 TaxID=3364995 RepID=UPI00379699D3